MREPPLHVTRYDEGRYLVRSEQPPRWYRRHDTQTGETVRFCTTTHYLVDLGDPEFPHGWCQCSDYSYRKSPKIHAKRDRRTRCKHVKAVQAELAHAEELCEMAGLPFSPKIIPTLTEYEHSHRHESYTFR